MKNFATSSTFDARLAHDQNLYG
ncbi:uncharacterized protein METZ01_LOCUS91261 [marine metagenome]|uniref:Uncharacterized protein n=1 Tax=marine metagenome TaxID=408172 RepID=A0A381VFI2_9ZZZZ